MTSVYLKAVNTACEMTIVLLFHVYPCDSHVFYENNLMLAAGSSEGRDVMLVEK